MKQNRQIAESNEGRRRFLFRFRQAERGSAAVEFALVGIPFLMLLLAMLETGIIFFANASIDHTTAQTARLIRTGQAQSGGFDEAAFKQSMCDGLTFLPDCLTRLHLDVRTFDSFADVNFPPPIEDGELTGNNQFQPGSAGDIVLVRAFYEWPVASPVATGLSTMSDGSRLLTASTAFRNEPF